MATLDLEADPKSCKRYVHTSAKTMLQTLDYFSSIVTISVQELIMFPKLRVQMFFLQPEMRAVFLKIMRAVYLSGYLEILRIRLPE